VKYISAKYGNPFISRCKFCCRTVKEFLNEKLPVVLPGDWGFCWYCYFNNTTDDFVESSFFVDLNKSFK